MKKTNSKRIKRVDFSFIIRLTDQYIGDLNSLNISWRRAQEELNKEFKVKWYIYRSLIPISVVSDLSVEEILSDTRVRSIFNARAIAMWITHHAGCFGYSSIGRAINRDHTTVANAVHVVDAAISNRSGPVYMMLMDVIDLEDQWH